MIKVLWCVNYLDMPKPFNFKLQKVLDYRGQLEDQAKMVLAKAIMEHDEQTEVVEKLVNRLTEHVQRGLPKNPTANDMWLWRQFKNRLEQDLALAQAKLAELALKLQKCRQEAVEKSRERKLLEKLKSNQSKKYYAEELLKEEKENDESATVRYQPPDI